MPMHPDSQPRPHRQSEEEGELAVLDLRGRHLVLLRAVAGEEGVEGVHQQEGPHHEVALSHCRPQQRGEGEGGGEVVGLVGQVERGQDEQVGKEGVLPEQEGHDEGGEGEEGGNGVVLDAWQGHRRHRDSRLVDLQFLQLHPISVVYKQATPLTHLLGEPAFGNGHPAAHYEPKLSNLITTIIRTMKERDDEEREDSLPGRVRKGKAIKKKGQPTREITHYFTKVQKQGTINRNIPTPDKAAIEQIDQAFADLQQQEHDLTLQIEDAKIRAERQKEEREYFLSKSRNLVACELKKAAEINRFFKRQDHLKLKDKQHLLNKTAEEVRRKKEALLKQPSNPFQEYFMKRELEKADRELKRISLEVAFLKESNRIAMEEEGCYFAKQGWPLLMKRYQPLELVGKGGFSEVYRSYDLYANQTVAIKLSSVEHLLQGCGNKHEYLKHIKREYEIHKQLDHPNIVKLTEVIEIQSAFCIVLQYCEGCTLAQYLRTEGAVVEAEAKMIVEQIGRVIHYLSSQTPSIIHYDLKPQNIIFSRGQLKVLDFGICKTMDSEHSKMALTSQGMGTCCYLPPETLLPNTPLISNKVDVWSLGIIFYELLKGTRPFGQTLSAASILGAGLDPTDFFADMKITQSCKAFILECLQVKESKRLNPLSILTHPYILNAESL